MNVALPHRHRIITYALAIVALVIGLGMAAGCDTDSVDGPDAGEPTCVAGLESAATCSPLYAPNFEAVHANTLRKSCSIAGSACHANAGAKGGLDLEDIDIAYEHLVGSSGRVLAGEPDCGVLIARLEALDARVMPPGSPLSEEARCAIRQWIAAGAKR